MGSVWYDGACRRRRREVSLSCRLAGLWLLNLASIDHYAVESKEKQKAF